MFLTDNSKTPEMLDQKLDSKGDKNGDKKDAVIEAKHKGGSETGLRNWLENELTSFDRGTKTLIKHQIWIKIWQKAAVAQLATSHYK